MLIKKQSNDKRNTTQCVSVTNIKGLPKKDDYYVWII